MIEYLETRLFFNATAAILLHGPIKPFQTTGTVDLTNTIAGRQWRHD